VVEIVTGEESLADTDAIVTRRCDITIGVRTADCVPIILYAPDIRAVAAVHAGWRGTLGGIVDNTVALLRTLGADTARIQAIFGPSICGNCYEVDNALADRFRAANLPVVERTEAREQRQENREQRQENREQSGEAVDYCKPHLNLQEVNRQRMLRLGIPAANITPSPFCTRHSVAAPSQPIGLQCSRLSQSSNPSVLPSPFSLLPSQPSSLPAPAPLFPSWRRSPGITDRLITAVRLTPQS
jgi:YfiH family protein